MRRVWLSTLVLAVATATSGQDTPAPVDFYGRIQPLLAIHCYKCHGADVQKGGLRLDVRERALKGGESGQPGPAEAARRVASLDHDEQMPPKGPRLSASEVQILRRWAEAGAPWPDRDDYWAFQPTRMPPLPEVKHPERVLNPIDRFLEVRLQREGIRLSPPADRRTLMRRVYADLVGVPPTPEEADAFLTDSEPDAYERLVDRLLADPRYGERWARHWLDLVRYAESDGYEDDKVRPHAWRYRDYVIRAFNADKPYNRFIQEQIAGDELFPDDPDAWVATGFARLGAWDGMSKNPPQQRQDYLNDATDAVGSVFLGMTVGCARCHDHKYDRVTQQDYYGLQAFFANTVRENRTIATEESDPAFVRDRYRQTRDQLAKVRAEREEIGSEAREIVLWRRRCEVGTDGQVKVTDDEVHKMTDRLHPGRRDALDKKIKELEKAERFVQPVAEAVFETSRSSPKTHLLRRGELSTPGPEIPPRFVEAMVAVGAAVAKPAPSPGAKGTGRRSELARWLSSPEHPTTARVLVNRLWQHHFGRGIVATPSDFGRNGRQPSHPELLDWLARVFVSDLGWSLKKMHRLMLTSAAYRRGSEATGTDLPNATFGRMFRRRLDAEALRDSILAVSGRLSKGGGGPGVYVPIPKDINVELPNNDKELSWETSTEEEGRRRTVYVFQRRSLTLPFVDVFDGAPMNQTCPQRPETTVAPQALTLFNGEFCRGEARSFAERVEREAGSGTDARIDRAFRLALLRTPSDDERDAARRFLATQPLADFCHVLFNTNEFLYLD
jgi:hypothetical protein